MSSAVLALNVEDDMLALDPVPELRVVPEFEPSIEVPEPAELREEFEVVAAIGAETLFV